MRISMRKKTTVFFPFVTFLLLAGVGSALMAGELDLLQLSGLTQSTISDNDAVLLSLIAGYQLGQSGIPPQTISFVSTTTDVSWSGSLSGLYLGKTLDLSYLGTNSGFPPGTVSWSITGTFGGGSVTGGGTSTISYPTSSTFNLAFSDQLVEGGTTYSADFTIPGTLFPNGNMFGSPENPEAPADGSYSVGGVNLAAVVEISQSGGWWWGVPTYTDVVVNGKVVWTDISKSVAVGPGSTIQETVYLGTPEPNDAILLASGLLAMAVVMRKRKRIADEIRQASSPKGQMLIT